ncbi:hypothetical protein PG984_011528 [Apiospora sp. TS-2023a]
MITRSACLSEARPASSYNTRSVLPLIRDLNRLDPEGLNALHYCSLYNAVGIANVLLETNLVDVDCMCGKGQTPLVYAAHSGSEDVAKALCQHGATLDLANRTGDTALELAVRKRHTGVASVLIRHGAPLWFGDKLNVLHLAVTTKSHPGSNVKQLLKEFPSELKAPEILNAFNKNGWTPLHIAAYFGDCDGVEALITAKADTTAFHYPDHGEKSDGGTPLDLVRKTIKRIERTGELSIDHTRIAEKGNYAIAQFEDRLDGIQQLLEQAMAP